MCRRFHGAGGKVPTSAGAPRTNVILPARGHKHEHLYAALASAGADHNCWSPHWRLLAHVVVWCGFLAAGTNARHRSRSSASEQGLPQLRRPTHTPARGMGHFLLRRPVVGRSGSTVRESHFNCLGNGGVLEHQRVEPHSATVRGTNSQNVGLRMRH